LNRIEFYWEVKAVRGDIDPLEVERDKKEKLDVITFDEAGRVGIGTTFPHERLSVSGNIENIQGNYYLDTSTGWGSWERGFYIRAGTGSVLGGFGAKGTAGTSLSYTYIGPNYSSAIAVFTPGGNVGIGTTSPQSKLSVGGDGITGATIFGNSTINYGYGVYGKTNGTGGIGVYGISDKYFGVYGKSTYSYGVEGVSTNSIAVYGSGGEYDFYGGGTSFFGILKAGNGASGCFETVSDAVTTAITVTDGIITNIAVSGSCG